MVKTYLEKIEQSPVLQAARFFKKSEFSPLVHAIRYTLLAMYGDRAAESEVRGYIEKASQEDTTNPILDTLRNILKKRVENQEWSKRVYPYLKQYNREGVPFSDYELEPAPISQIKKIVNAFYYAEETLKRVEALDLDGLFRRNDNTVAESLEVILGPFVDDVYELCRLVTQPDVNLVATFGDEWLSIHAIVSELASKASGFLKGTNQFLADEYNIDVKHPLSVVHQAGELSGVGLSHLKPTTDVNYTSISYFSANLSSYLNQMTQSIQSFALTHLTDTSYLNKQTHDVEKYQLDAEKLHALDKAAVRLATAFENLYAFKLLQSVNAVALTHIIRSAITLVTGIIDEAGHFRAESEGLVRDALADLKYKKLLELMILIDKIEEEMVMVPRPGVLSRPLMSELKSFYGFLYGFVEGFVDLSASGQDLAKLEDSRFIEQRAQACFERQAEREALQVQQQGNEKSVDAFFELLLPHQNKRLRDLDEKVKQELIRRFKVIRNEVAEVDIALYNVIVNGLNADSNAEATWGEYFYEQANAFTGGLAESHLGDYPDRISNICHPLQAQLKNRLQKQKATFDFKSVLNQDVIDYVYESLDTLLQHPHDLKKDALKVNEAVVLKIKKGKKITRENQALDLETLTLDQTLALYQAHALQRHKLVYAEQSVQQFIRQLEHERPETRISSVHHRNRLRNLYTIFQPAMITAMADVAHVNDVHVFDKAMIDALSGRETSDNPLTVENVRAVYEKTRERLVLEKDNAALRMISLQAAIQQKTIVADEKTVLVADTEGEVRATYLVKKPLFEAYMNDMQLKLESFIKQFSQTVQSNLKFDEKTVLDKTKSNLYNLKFDEKTVVSNFLNILNLESKTLPFPEVEPPLNSDSLKQPQQLIGLKQLINCFYHLRETSIQVEQLDSRSDKRIYAWRVFQMEQHIRATTDLMFEISKDPHFYAIAKDLYDTFQETNASFQTFKTPHVPEKTNKDSHLEPHDVVFYIVNSLMISTRQIEQWQSNKTITDEAAQKVHEFAERFSADVSRLLESDTFCKWVMEVKTPFTLFTQIKNRWNNFAKSASGSIQQNLEAMSTETLSDALIEADERERKIGLKPGLLSSPLKQIFDAYYQGMIGALSNDSWHEIDLATSMVSFHKRIERIDAHIGKATAELAGCAADNQGLMSTIQFTLDSLLEQKTYIQAQRKIQVATNEQFEKEYVKKAIKKGLKAYQSAAKNLLYGGKLYDEALVTHIDAHASDFISGVNRSEPLEKQVKTFLSDNVQAFDSVNFEEYQQYDALHKSVAVLKTYISDQRDKLSRLDKETIKHTWSFESVETLEVKSNLVIKLESILNDTPGATTQIPIKDRIKQFANEVSSPIFENKLLTYQKYNTISLSWIVQWLVNVLTVLKLYKSEAHIVHDHLKQSGVVANQKVNPAQVGLFAVKPPIDEDDEEEHLSIDKKKNDSGMKGA